MSSGASRRYSSFWVYVLNNTYHCYRIIFSFSEEEKLLEMVILLVDIGSHDEVY